VCHLPYNLALMALSSKIEQARVDFRVPASVKARFQEAAAYETAGDLSAFLVAAALERADRVLAQRETLLLDDTTRERFYSAMRAKPIPSTRLRQLMNEDDTLFKLVE
jgi:uncharacterized protein (DUF1778 family)